MEAGAGDGPRRGLGLNHDFSRGRGSDLYRIAVVEGKTTSTVRLRMFSDYCVQEADRVVSRQFDDFFDPLVRQVTHRNPKAIP